VQGFANAATSIILHPATVVAADHQAPTNAVGLLTRSGWNHDHTMPDALLSHIHGLQLALSPLQHVGKAALQLQKRALGRRLLPMGEQYGDETPLRAGSSWVKRGRGDLCRHLLLPRRGADRFVARRWRRVVPWPLQRQARNHDARHGLPGHAGVSLRHRQRRRRGRLGGERVRSDLRGQRRPRWRATRARRLFGDRGRARGRCAPRDLDMPARRGLVAGAGEPAVGH